MKISLKLEELGMFALSFMAFVGIGGDWIAFLILLFTPDIGMLGYLASNRVGAITYNLLHHKGIACLFIMLGLYFSIPTFIFVGIILFAHSSIDRVLGYGLKRTSNFKDTHLEDSKEEPKEISAE